MENNYIDIDGMWYLF